MKEEFYMNFYELPKTIENDINKYERSLTQYMQGLLTKDKFKSIRVPYGVYEQRQNDRYMMRIRLPGGAITPSQLAGVAEIAKRYSGSPLHFTTRQDVQIHDLTLIDTLKIMKELRKLGLSSRGGGGNTVRNIIASVDSTIDDEEVFDVSPYVQALTSRLIAESDSWTLPRKLKIAFSSSSKDKGLATVNDLGFIAKKDNQGNRGFAVYIGGGMGRKPRVSFLLYKYVNADEVYNITRAVKNLFDKYGNRKNKYQARLRFLVEKYGREKFRELFESEYQEVKKKHYPPLELAPHSDSEESILEIPLFMGLIDPERALALASILKGYGDNTIRIMTNQNILIRNINSEKVSDLISELKRMNILFDIPRFLGNSVACAGAATCRLGICLSRNLLKAIRKKLEENHFNYDRISDLRLKISGCSNSCGQHLIADIGFYGMAKRNSGRLVPFYQFLIGGVVREGNTKLAEVIGPIPARNIPSFLYEVLKYITETRNDNESFTDFLARTGKDWIFRLFDQYVQVPSYNEDSSFYYDLYSDKPFSLADRSSGECAAGLFDLIELDLQTARQEIDAAYNEYNPLALNELLRKAILSTCRALLITKGFEPEEDRKAVSLFREHFIGIHVDGKWKAVVDKYLKGETPVIDEVEGLYNAVKKLYESMDDSLRFPDLTETERTQSEKGDKTHNVHDFRGVGCPLNFVKTKLVLETLNPGEAMEILIDDGEPIDNVPASLEQEGHRIVEKEKVSDYWRVLIIKGGE